MKTLYADVYFLINFTVDFLALYFASLFSKIPTGTIRLVLAAIVGGMYAVMGVIFIENQLFMYPISLLIIVFMVLITAKRVSLYRKMKYMIALLMFQIIIGGLVYYGYCLLDRFFSSEDYVSSGGENKEILILSVMILLSIGILKLIIRAFGNIRAEQSVYLEINYNSHTTTLEAFIDSGNLAVNPMDKTPVMLVTLNTGDKIFGNDCYQIQNPDTSAYSIRKRILVIPLSFGDNKKILYGIRADSVCVIKKNKKENISVIIAIDDEGSGYGGYGALIPLSALDDVL